MSRQLRNPYLWIILGPLTAFLILVSFHFPPDWISVPGRLGVFGLLAYVGLRYVGRAPVLAWQGNLSPEARNVVGWAMCICAMMFQQLYGTIYIAYDRPEWLSSLYWGPSFVILMLVGLGLVTSSVPRFWPFGGASGGMGTAASFMVGFLSAGALFSAQHLPTLWKLFSGFMLGLIHAF